jgi:hypothetical protein
MLLAGGGNPENGQKAWMPACAGMTVHDLIDDNIAYPRRFLLFFINAGWR